MLRRREFMALAAAAPAAGAAIDLGRIPIRKAGKVETVFKSPGPKPNGLQATKDGLWIMDQGDGNRVSLVRYEDGKVLRDFATDADKASGITFDGEAIWLASTYSRELIRADAMTGKTIQKYFTPGAGVIYRMVGDPPARSSPLAKATPPKPSKGAQVVGGFQQGQVVGSKAPGTGAHGLEWRDGKLWVAVPPSRTIYRIDPKEWIVEQKFGTAANRPHGIGWEGRYLWCTDSNLNAFFKHDPTTGEMVEKIQLSDSDPLPHGMTVWQGTMWYCDDVGVVCRLKL
jgi:streptogramin lyase